MQTMNYILNDFDALDNNSKVISVKEAFNSLPFKQLPVVSNDKYLGMILQDDIIYSEKNDDPLSEFQHLFQNYKTEIPDSCIDLIKLFAQHNTDILPVVDINNNYIGYFELNDILQLFYNSPFISQTTSSLVIAKESSQFTMGEIAQIVETNNVRLLGMYISSMTNNQTEITLRIDTENINDLIQSFRRYDYKILNTNKSDLMVEELKNRSEYLEKYLNI